MSAVRIAHRYSKSLLDLALEQNALEDVNNDINLIAKTIKENRDFELMLKSPIITGDKKEAILDGVFSGKVTNLVSVFLKIVVNKKREAYLGDMAKSFAVKYNIQKQITPAKLVTATTISNEVEQSVEQMVAQKFNRPTVDLTTEVDESLIGGFVLRFEDKLYDASLKRQFDDLKGSFYKNDFVIKF